MTGELPDLVAAARYLDAERSPRYQPDQRTYCNVFASDFCALLNVYLPRVWWTELSIQDGITPYSTAALGRSVREMTANALYNWLRTYGSHYGWEEQESLAALQAIVATGQVGMVTGRSSTNAGHLSFVLSADEDASGNLIQTQAGRQCSTVRSVPKWWEGGEYEEVGYWTNTSPRARPPSPQRISDMVLRPVMPMAIGFLERELEAAARLQRELPDVLLEALVAAEDKRFWRHKGFDPIAICRAVHAGLFAGRRQGASTIEQQLVRTLTGFRAKTVRRKLVEIALAYWCATHYPKRLLASIYLEAAYYGSNAHGLRAACARLNVETDSLDLDQAALLVSALRHPIPLNLPMDARHPWRARARWIANRIGKRGPLSRKTLPARAAG